MSAPSAARHVRPLAPITRRSCACCSTGVRDGFERLDAGEIDAFKLDELINRYKRSARELWKFCGQTGSGWVRAVRTLEFWREQGEELPDWWEAGEPRRRA